MFKLRYPLIALASALFGAVAAIGVYMYYVPLPNDAIARGEALNDDAARPWLGGAMTEIFPTRTVEAAATGAPLPRSDGALNGFTFDHGGETRTLADLYDTQGMLGLVVMKDGVVVHETYAPDHGPATLFTTWSVVKSITSTLVGAAVRDGLISDVNDPLVRYLPELRGTAYDGVSIREALEMSSGVGFDLETGDDTVEFLTDGPITAKRSAFDLAAGYSRHAEPGTVFNYNTAETQILLELVRTVTSEPAADYLSEAIWQPVGMRHNGAWVIDAAGEDGAEIGGALFNAALMDWARFGQFIAQDGVWNGERLLPEGWVDGATQSGAPHLMPGEVHPDPELGYGWQWWTRADGTFQASGAYGQLIYIDRANQLVVAKVSAWEEAYDPGHAAETRALTRALSNWSPGEIDAEALVIADAAGSEPSEGPSNGDEPVGAEPEAATEPPSEPEPSRPALADQRPMPDRDPERAAAASEPEAASPSPAGAETAPTAPSTDLPPPSVKPELDTAVTTPGIDQPAETAPSDQRPIQAPGEGMGVAESRFLEPEELED